MAKTGGLLRICAIASHVFFSEAHVYLGCGSADFGDVSCTPGDATFHVRCSGILSGSVPQKAQQCNALCLSYLDYIAFSIQNSTSCLCKKSMPNVDSYSTEVDHCTKSDVVFSLQEELRPSFLLRLERSDQLALTITTEGGLRGFQTRNSSTLNQNFFLGRCVHQEAAACLADVNSWKGTGQIKSGDIVALVSQSLGLAYVCNNVDCEQEAFPPNIIAALYRIKKASGNGVAADGTAINFGDSVYLYSLEFEANVVCDEVRCGVSSPGINAIDNGQFVLKKAQEDGILSSNAMVKLFKDGKAATLSGMRYDEEIHSNWFLGKCGSGSIKCPIDYDIMNDGLAAFDTTEPIKSGDIVAWVNQGTSLNQGMNCVDDDIPCMLLNYPPEPGFQGAFFKIIKVVNDVPVSPGSVIRFGDEVYFYTLQYLEWIESRHVDCKDNNCAATTHSTIPLSKFYLLEAARSTCAAYRCYYGYRTKVPNAASTLLTHENCCQSDSATEDSQWWIAVLILCATTLCCCICVLIIVAGCVCKDSMPQLLKECCRKTRVLPFGDDGEPSQDSNPNGPTMETPRSKASSLESVHAQVQPEPELPKEKVSKESVQQPPGSMADDRPEDANLPPLPQMSNLRQVAASSKSEVLDQLPPLPSRPMTMPELPRLPGRNLPELPRLPARPVSQNSILSRLRSMHASLPGSGQASSQTDILHQWALNRYRQEESVYCFEDQLLSPDLMIPFAPARSTTFRGGQVLCDSFGRSQDVSNVMDRSDLTLHSSSIGAGEITTFMNDSSFDADTGGPVSFLGEVNTTTPTAIGIADIFEICSADEEDDDNGEDVLRRTASATSRHTLY